MRIVFFGDSITDAGRNYQVDFLPEGYGNGYVMQIAGSLLKQTGDDYEIINRGISGNRIVDIYARLKRDVINLKPDVLSILIGVNDVWHEIGANNGVELDKFEKIYEMMIDEALEKLPDLKIILCEPFVLCGDATRENYDAFLEVKNYAKVVKKIADRRGFTFVPLQDEFDAATLACPVEKYLYDGVHPNVAGAKLIADEWLKAFNK